MYSLGLFVVVSHGTFQSQIMSTGNMPGTAEIRGREPRYLYTMMKQREAGEYLSL
jgi:hypothetical protein